MKGYALFSLSKNGKTKTIMAHRLVAQAFLPNPKNKKTINHINGIKTDNRVDNLEWNTHSENITHAFRTGLKMANKPMAGREGFNHPSSKPINQYVKDGAFIQTWGSANQAAKALKIGQSHITSCVKGRASSAGGFTWQYAEINLNEGESND
jgi:hypothetical protein